MIPPLIRDIYQHFPISVRRRIQEIRHTGAGLALKLKLKPIRVDACLRGNENGLSAAALVRVTGDSRSGSSPISEWPQVKLLRQYDSIGEHIWQPEVFEKTDYYRNAAFHIELLGKYFNAIAPAEIQEVARRFVNAYHGRDDNSLPPELPDDESDPRNVIAVHPVRDAACYQVVEGHHRLAIAYMRGIREVRGLILDPPVTTPLQDLLHDVLWLNGRQELYQPVDAPEVSKWVLVRRCSDRLAKMTTFLEAEGLMPADVRSYLDVACSYGWFVSQMERAGFRAEGVERDPVALSVGKTMYGLRPEQLHRSDAVTFLAKLQRPYDITSCLSLAHHYILHRQNITAEELLGLLDLATRRVLFFDMGQGHEYPGEKLGGWDPDRIHGWLEANTTFSRIVRLGKDHDAVPPNQHNFGRMLFACLR